MSVSDEMAHAQSAVDEWRRAERRFEELADKARHEGPPGSVAAETMWAEAQHYQRVAAAWRHIAAVRSLAVVELIAEGVTA